MSQSNTVNRYHKKTLYYTALTYFFLKVPVKSPVTIPKKECYDVKAKHCHTVPVKKPRTIVKKVPKLACVTKGHDHYGHDDHHGGYGHDDHHGGYGHNEHHGGYGHDEHHGGGYGHDDHHGGYDVHKHPVGGYKDHGSGYSHHRRVSLNPKVPVFYDSNDDSKGSTKYSSYDSLLNSITKRSDKKYTKYGR